MAVHILGTYYGSDVFYVLTFNISFPELIKVYKNIVFLYDFPSHGKMIRTVDFRTL